MKSISDELHTKACKILQMIEEISLINISRYKSEIVNIIESIDYESIKELEENNNVIDNQKKEIENLKEQIKVLEAKVSKKGKAGRKEILSEEQKDQIKKMYLEDYWSMPKLAKAFNVSLALIHKVVHEK